MTIQNFICELSIRNGVPIENIDLVVSENAIMGFEDIVLDNIRASKVKGARSINDHFQNLCKAIRDIDGTNGIPEISIINRPYFPENPIVVRSISVATMNLDRYWYKLFVTRYDIDHRCHIYGMILYDGMRYTYNYDTGVL